MLAFPVIIRSDIKASLYQSVICSLTVCEFNDCSDQNHGRTFKAKSYFTLNEKRAFARVCVDEHYSLCGDVNHYILG